jgi:thymidylate synthase (FAD)
MTNNTARIVALTQPLILVDDEDQTGRRYMTPEEFIAYTARVSNPTNQMNSETSSKLLRYCIKNKHWSIFEQVSITMEIDTTRDIAHQIIRHRSFSFQEFSQRYADPTTGLGFVSREARLQDTKNRQNSIETEDDDLQWGWELRQSYVTDLATKNYNWAIENGIAKEQARVILPEGLTKTRLYMSGTLRSWIHYIDLRAAEGTQKEHREVAIAAREELVGRFEFLKDYWNEDDITVSGLVVNEQGQNMDIGKPEMDLLKSILLQKIDTDLYETEKKPWWKFW